MELSARLNQNRSLFRKTLERAVAIEISSTAVVIEISSRVVVHQPGEREIRDSERSEKA